MQMKLIRVPWIRCRADEAGAKFFEMQWHRIHFDLLAYSESEARDWWNGLSDDERNVALGLNLDDPVEQPDLF